MLRPDESLATVARRELDARFADLARQVWVPQWRLPDGVTLDQPVLQYPAVNVAVEAGAAVAYLPVDGVGVRTLTGSGWAAGVLLRPGAGALVVPGDIETKTGGYGYDRAMTAGLAARGWNVAVVSLPGEYPFPTVSEQDTAASLFASIPDGSLVLVDGLALGVLPDIAAPASNLPVQLTESDVGSLHSLGSHHRP